MPRYLSEKPIQVNSVCFISQRWDKNQRNSHSIKSITDPKFMFM